MSEVLSYCITVFLTQLIFIGCRTWNVRAVAQRKIGQVLLSGAVVHLSWLLSIAIGVASMNEILTNWDWSYLPVVMSSLVGGLLGSWIAMKR